jgi:hypothetical protein
MPVFECTSRVSRRSLMNQTKDELATRVLELMEEIGTVRDRMEKVESRAAGAKAWARHGAEMVDGERQAEAMLAAIARGMTTEAEAEILLSAFEAGIRHAGRRLMQIADARPPEGDGA